MAKITSSESALPQPLTISDQQFDALEKLVRCTLGADLREQFEQACNSYRDHCELQQAAPRPKDVADELARLEAKLRDASETISRLLASDEPGAQQAIHLLSVRRGADPEIEPLTDFSNRVRAMAGFASDELHEFEKAFAGLRGRDHDFALDQLIVRIEAIAQAAGIPVTAHYSDIEGHRLGRFVALVHEAYRLCHGLPFVGSGLEERIKRVLAPTDRQNCSEKK